MECPVCNEKIDELEEWNIEGEAHVFTNPECGHVVFLKKDGKWKPNETGRISDQH
jgi:sarcosine oxidase delta subunit